MWVNRALNEIVQRFFVDSKTLNGCEGSRKLVMEYLINCFDRPFVYIQGLK